MDVLWPVVAWAAWSTSPCVLLCQPSDALTWRRRDLSAMTASDTPQMTMKKNGWYDKIAITSVLLQGIFKGNFRTAQVRGAGDGSPPAGSRGGAETLSFTVTYFNGIFEQFYAY